MLYLITYDLRSPGRDYSNLYSAIKGLERWWHYLDSTWIVNSPNDPATLTTMLRQYMDTNDSLLVVDITGRKRWGWLPKEAWDWLSRNDN